MLEIRELNSFYGSSHILHGVSLTVEEAQGVCLVGRNGAGKSTTLKSVMGLVDRTAGEITFQGKDVRGKRPYAIARLGIGYVPEDRRIYPDLSVVENLRLGRYAAKGRDPMSVDEALDLFPLLKNLRRRSGGVLSGGEQQALSVARTLMGRPELLLLDEPSEGLAPLIAESLQKTLHRMRDEHRLAVLLAEQNLRFALDLTDYVYVIDNGQLVYQGQTEDFRRRRDLQREYLAV